MFVFQYKFEGTSEIREIKCENESMEGDIFCELILKDVGTLTCKLFTSDTVVDTSKVTVVQRKYSNKFITDKDTSKEPGEIVESPVRVRRWRSRSPVKRRWKSRSPKRYKRVYSVY